MDSKKIWYKDLVELGFEDLGNINNREFFERNGFTIIEHHGDFKVHAGGDTLYGKGRALKTKDAIKKAYNQFVDSKIDKLQKQINELKQLKKSKYVFSTTSITKA